jgi:putative ABC transport system permease protein
MLKNYINISIRNLRKNGVSTAINIIGLSLGMAAFILIFQYISFEKSVNSFHSDLPNLYRIVTETKEGEVWDDTAPGLAPVYKQEIGEIKEYCRIAVGTSLGDGVVGVGDTPETMQSFRERNFAYAEGSFFQLFSFPIAEGKAESLKSPNTVALSISTARKYFGSQNGLGRVITLNNQFGKTTYSVGLVYDDMPENSDFRFDAIFSIHTLESKSNLNGNEDWASLEGVKTQWLKTYLQLQPAGDPENVGNKAMALKRKANPENTDKIQLQPLANQHLAKSLNFNFDYFNSMV